MSPLHSEALLPPSVSPQMRQHFVQGRGLWRAILSPGHPLRDPPLLPPHFENSSYIPATLSNCYTKPNKMTPFKQM